MIQRALYGLLVLFILTACEGGEPNEMSLKDYEGPEGEAVVRYVIKNLPPVEPEVPKVYTVVKGDALASVNLAFTRNLGDLKLTFVSGEVLTVRQPDQSIVDPRSGLSPVTIQLTRFRKAGSNRWEVHVGWAYKKLFERRKLVLEEKDGQFTVTANERLEGNYTPADEPVPDIPEA